MSTTILTIEVRFEQDVVMTRQRARQIAELLGFDSQDQTRIATAVSEIARNAFQYAKGGKVEFWVEGESPNRGQETGLSSQSPITNHQSLWIAIRDRGPGISNLQAILDGQYKSKTGMGLGIIGSKRLMDQFILIPISIPNRDLHKTVTPNIHTIAHLTTQGVSDSNENRYNQADRSIESLPEQGTTVLMAKTLPVRSPILTAKRLAQIADELVMRSPQNPFEEIQQQNQELLRTLEELLKRQEELTQVNRELEDTNRGVVALYAELDEKADSLQRANELKTRFLSNMSHEFRTPLNSIVSLSRLLLDRMDGELTPEQEKQVTFIRKSAEGLSELVNDLLDLAKVEAGKIVVHPNEFEVSDLFGALRGMLRPLLTYISIPISIPNRDLHKTATPNIDTIAHSTTQGVFDSNENRHNSSISLVFEDPVGIPTLHTDEGKVAQILRNLISNALKYTEHGEVRVAADRRGNTVVFSVADTGIGIAPEDQERIFEDFMQVDSHIQKRVKGTGLGLPLSRKLAELLGGSVSLKSELGKGSTFFATIPLKRDLQQKLLIIDDDQVSRYLLKELLADTHFTIIEAAKGREGIAKAHAENPQAIFLDLVMPDINGFEVLEQLKSNPATRNIPVIINTSKILEAEERRHLADRTVAILSKDRPSREVAIALVREAIVKAGLVLEA